MSSSTIRNQITTGEHSQEQQEEDYLFAIHLTTAGSLPMVLKAAVELDIFETMAKAGPGAYISASQLADQLQTKNPDAPFMLDRILCLLATYSVLKCTVGDLPHGKVERLYGLAPVCKFLTKDANGYSLAPLLLMNHDKILMESWYHLKDAVVEGGIAFDKAYGMPSYKYFNSDPKYSKLFNQGLSNHSAIAMNKLLEVYHGFEGVETLVDVGGGIGAELNVILSKYPSIKGINFDLPHVIHDAPPYPGIEHVGGDMFVSVPKGDAIFMKHTCHNWSDELCSKVLKNCYNALPNNGKVIIAESIMPVVPDTGLTSKNVIDTDVIMLANTTGGKERTVKEFEALAKTAGFEGFRVAHTGSNPCVMEFLKKT